jgi:hypothetical protein
MGLFVFFELSTPKAFANSSPGLLQPWGNRRTILRTLKEFLTHMPNTFSVLFTYISAPRVEATLGWNYQTPSAYCSLLKLTRYHLSGL